MNIQVDPTSSNLASAMLNSKIRPRAVVGYGTKIFHPGPPNYVTRSPGQVEREISEHKFIHEITPNLKEKISAKQRTNYKLKRRDSIFLDVEVADTICCLFC